MMIDKFKRIQEKFKAFYYAYDVDSDGRLTKLFWADSIGRRNFELNGDTISFNATFDTNRYNLIFAPFTGVDKHDRCVTFASCLLSHESVADYSWVFVHLLKAMGRNHVLIITDQCPAMKVSVRDVFSDVNGIVRSKLRLCMWHIMEKFLVKMMIDKFKRIQEKFKAFYYAYDVDSDGRLTKLFWADSIGRRNFELNGDTISFNATFDTNRYNLIFAPFTGVDKHDRCVTFASCLLSHESVADYSWVFVHLLKAMGRNHVLIITDQCPAMKVSVRDVFSDVNGIVRSKLRLCMWHIMEKFLVKGNVKKWKGRPKKENVKNWLGRRENEPMFGLLRTTSRSESENSFFGQFHKQGDTLCEFWLRFETTMDKQRNEMVRLDHELKSSLPITLSKWFIEDDATTLYTRTIFYKIPEETIISCLEMQIKRMSEEVDGVTHFEIRDVRVKDKLFKISVSMNHTVCSCKKFMMCGIVCRHAFCGLKQIGVTKFPRSFVLNRWMQTADSGTSSNLDVVGIEMDRLEHVHNTIKKLNTEFDDYEGYIVSFTKKDHIAAMVGK
ncbi:protein FAR1-RELATED SEQUENCE 5-like [Apium graveolens]|uniref:protein FAR1-RELATED SEQUENCE 5-like n=1 Tax=Apium graveolens TaxID=4045 RepID=UPI003D792D42